MFSDRSLVEWCESNTHRYIVSKYITEYTNSLSNVFFIIMAVLSMYNYPTNLPQLFWKCDTTLILIGLGSFYFHASETFIGEMIDEISMSILMYYYTDIVCHIMTWHFSRNTYIGIVVITWVWYLVYRQYAFFILLFICQLVIPIYITIMYITKTRRQKQYLVNAAISITVAKLCWVYERYLYAHFECPLYMSSPTFYLHSYWHMGTAIGHYWMMLCFVSMYTKVSQIDIDIV